jgi:Flp pilus assembly pilin Flp
MSKFGSSGKLIISITRFLSRVAQDERGQTTTEYILLLTFVVAGTAALAKTVVGALNTGVLTLGAELEKDLKTGRTTISVWTN